MVIQELSDGMRLLSSLKLARTRALLIQGLGSGPGLIWEMGIVPVSLIVYYKVTLPLEKKLLHSAFCVRVSGLWRWHVRLKTEV